MKRRMGRTAPWVALVAAASLGTPVGASAAAPVVGLGVGMGEQGFAGANLRVRPGDLVGLEVGAGTYYYSLRAADEQIEGFIPAYGGEVVFYATPRALPTQHAFTMVMQYTEVTGMLCGFGYRYEYYLNDGRTGLHFEVGDFFLHPGGRARAQKFYEKKSGNSGDDLDYKFVPLLLKVGMQF